MPLALRRFAGEKVGECGIGVGAWASIQVPHQTRFSLGQRGRRRPSGNVPSTTLQIFSSRRQLFLSTVHRPAAPPQLSLLNDGTHNAKMSEEKPLRPLPFGYTFAAGESPTPRRLHKTAQLFGAAADRECASPGAIAGVSEVLGHSRCAWPTR